MNQVRDAQRSTERLLTKSLFLGSTLTFVACSAGFDVLRFSLMNRVIGFCHDGALPENPFTLIPFRNTIIPSAS